MIEHIILNVDEHRLIIRPNPAMSWKLIKKIYTSLISIFMDGISQCCTKKIPEKIVVKA